MDQTIDHNNDKISLNDAYRFTGYICMFVQLIAVTGAKVKRRGLADWFSLDESEI